MTKEETDNTKRRISKLCPIETDDIIITTNDNFCFTCDKERKQYIFLNQEKQVFAMIDDCKHGRKTIYCDSKELK